MATPRVLILRAPGANCDAETQFAFEQAGATPGRCPFLKGCDRLHLPVAHGEGRLVCRESWILQGLDEAGQVVLRYVRADGGAPTYPDNPNGSQGDVAGLCDVSGRVFGLM